MLTHTQQESWGVGIDLYWATCELIKWLIINKCVITTDFSHLSKFSYIDTFMHIGIVTWLLKHICESFHVDGNPCFTTDVWWCIISTTTHVMQAAAWKCIMPSAHVAVWVAKIIVENIIFKSGVVLDIKIEGFSYCCRWFSVLANYHASAGHWNAPHSEKQKYWLWCQQI